MAQKFTDRPLSILWCTMERQGPVTIQVGNNEAVVQDTATTQPETLHNLGGHVHNCRTMVAKSNYPSSLSVKAFARHYLRQEPGALAAHAGICAGGAG